jgi:transcription-repair coupling factor (superfamily II helicase)
MGYTRIERADEPGTFSMRGDTIDIYQSDAAYPVRVELFGDDVEAIRRVVAGTGQSIGTVDKIEVFPAREPVATAYDDGTYATLLDWLGVSALTVLIEPRSLFDDAKHYYDDKLASWEESADYKSFARSGGRSGTRSGHDGGTAAHGAAGTHEGYDDFADGFMGGLPEVNAKAATTAANSATTKTKSTGKGQPVDMLSATIASPAQLDFSHNQQLTFLSLMVRGAKPDARIEVKHPDILGSLERLAQAARAMLQTGNHVYICASDRAVRKDIELALGDVGVSFVEMSDIGAHGASDAAGVVQIANVARVANISIPTSLIMPQAKLAVLTLSDTASRRAAASGRRRSHIDPTSVTFPFNPGDYVVHAVHGIALFKEIVRREVAGVERDYLYLEYAKGDKLFCPVEQIDKLTRYVGPAGAAPRLTRLNTSDWSRATGRARKAAKKLAFDLVDLYSRRSNATGFAYPPDNEMQYEMELQFPYQETPDQLSAIADIKADMEDEKPMDRLLCGDVGFGKTEVALRAAFKAIQGGKQVMLLCPTTILAQQHYITFKERFDPFGVRTEVLSRFRSSAEQRQVLVDTAAGKVDLLIGTHRLLSADVNPKELGLIIIDEEQRFGVQHKEQLKNLREQVDVLTLSATPIPRTLQMAMSGVRDMSLIQTPPPNRTPIKVHVGEWDEDVVSTAIRTEVGRSGQVYYVSNRVKSIDDAVARVRDTAPEARIGVAHGQMGKEELEDVMERFAAREIDVLVSTTIIESGLDNPHTNTLIIEDSQRLGLAQLYQLKGRVGRSQRQAYAYFLFPNGNALTQEAVDRLTAIEEHQELGSGLKIAMKDLEIRGAGSLLGAEQHGNLTAVGFDLFASMLQEAVSEARGEQPAAHGDIRIDLPVHFYLPDEYIPAADERVLFYRRIAAAMDLEDVEGVQKELETRYGAMPAPAANLILREHAKVLAASLGINSITLVRGKLNLEPVVLAGGNTGEAGDKDVKELRAWIKERRGTYMVKTQKLLFPVSKDEEPLDVLIKLLEKLQ